MPLLPLERLLALVPVLRRVLAAADHHTRIVFNPPLTRALIASR